LATEVRRLAENKIVESKINLPYIRRSLVDQDVSYINSSKLCQAVELYSDRADREYVICKHVFCQKKPEEPLRLLPKDLPTSQSQPVFAKEATSLKTVRVRKRQKRKAHALHGVL